MIPLNARGTAHLLDEQILGKIVSEEEPHWRSRIRLVRRWNELGDVSGYRAIVCGESPGKAVLEAMALPVLHGVPVDHLGDGDVVVLDPSGHVRTLYRRASPHNSLFATDRCNSLCLMCSQPPRKVNDDWRVQEMLDTIALIDPSSRELGLTGGEPTILKAGFLSVVDACKTQLPETSLHVLSNGRLFRYDSFARALGDLHHHDLMIGVPVYADTDDRHDHVVQARGAFEDTILGLHNLARHQVPVEIRVVVHRHTYKRLPQLADFIYRNLTFASHVALMGLEIMGFARANLETLWMDPTEYREQLEEATLFLATRGMNVSIYNHQLCTIPETLWPYARKSISDWKNEYADVCADCAARTACGGFFASVVQSKRMPRLAPIRFPDVGLPTA